MKGGEMSDDRVVFDAAIKRLEEMSEAFNNSLQDAVDNVVQTWAAFVEQLQKDVPEAFDAQGNLKSNWTDIMYIKSKLPKK